MTSLDNLQRQVPLPWHSRQWERLLNQAADATLAHAYLVAGSAGLGKLAFVQHFAEYLLCIHPAATGPCGQCRNCESGLYHQHPDVLKIGPEEGARDIKIEQIRNLSDFLNRTSHGGGARIVIIDGAHHMNISASNALLKSLEEPGPSSYLFLVSDLPGQLTATIRSRCQRLQFSVPSFDQASNWLRQHLDPDEDPVRLLAAAGNRPLAALELSQTGTLDVEQDFISRLYGLLGGELSLASLVAQAGKVGESTTITCLLKISARLTHLVLGHEPALQEVDQENIRNSLNITHGSPLQQLRAIQHFYSEAMDAQRQIQSSANPNAQLILESLLWKFGKLSATGS